MKQTILMVLLTAFGTLGGVVHPFYGVLIYYLFAVLRPQAMWEWALPFGVPWSQIVAIGTLIGAVLHMGKREARPGQRSVGWTHGFVALFAVWLLLSYANAMEKRVAAFWLTEYLKIFLMFAVATFALESVRQLRWLVIATALSIAYIAYEVNFLYFVNGYLGIYRSGYGGLDNNGAGLMLAMGVPLCLAVWDMERTRWRWLFVSFVPVILHAVLMTYSRGAMVSLVIAAPLIIVRSSRRRQMTLAGVALLGILPFLAGQEIRARFFSVEQYQADGSANSRFESWKAAGRIALDYPVFGAGIRNSQMLSYSYGADMEGRTIHSQYLQILADSGFPALFFYVGALGTAFLGVRRVRRQASGDSDEDRFARGIATAVETSLSVFCVGAFFLSLEVFELPWLLVLLGSQVVLVYVPQFRPAEGAPALPAPEPSLVSWAPRGPAVAPRR